MKIFKSFLFFLVTIAIPVVLLMTSIRILINPFVLNIEYSLPGFPPDIYGFDKEDRLHWANLSVKYLINDADISYLGDLQFADGQPVFNERELSHMLDVKILVQLMLKVWLGLLAGLVLVGVISWRMNVIDDFWFAVRKGGWLTIILIAMILVGVALSFNALFTGFHKIFFEGDTWLFLFSDTLIRLFPLRFWQDMFIYMGSLTALGGLLLGLSGRRKS